MNRFITGLPRSGKSYFMVNDIVTRFVDHKHKDYTKHQFLYTNIGGLKIDDLNLELAAHPIETDEGYIQKKIILLDFKKLYHHLTALYEIANTVVEDLDDKLLEYCEKHNLTPAWFVFDETYLYFKKRSDPVLVWWLAYHAHMGHDIDLMLQNKGMLHDDYLCFSETFIDAQPKSMSLSDNIFRYYVYASEQYNAKQRYETKNLIIDQRIFSLYKSGDRHKPKKILYKYLALFVVAFLIVFLAFARLLNKGTPESSPPESVTIQPAVTTSDGTTKELEDGELYILRCDKSTCTLVGSSNYAYPFNYVKSVVVVNNLKYIYSSVVNYVSSVDNLTAISYFTDYYYQISPVVFRRYFKEWTQDIQIESTSYFGTESGSAPATDRGT
jgi:zona occludens toxin